MKYILVVILTGFSGPLLASTFVGNGGNAGDIERGVAVQQILGALKSINKEPPTNSSLCKCNSQYQSSNLCDALKNLNEDQRLFCARTLKVLTGPAMNIISQEQLTYSWTDQNIQVKEDNSLRAVDAVTDPQQKKITLHLQRFLTMNDSQRVFLLSHEFMHLVKYQGKYLEDTGSIGPFKGADGKRNLINAMSASVVMSAFEEKLFKKYRNTLDRPKPWKSHRLEAGLSGISVTDTDSDTNVYTNDKLSGGHLLYRYQTQSPWGFSVALKFYDEEKTILTSIQAKESLKGGAAGISYRLFPFDDPLSFLGQSHLVFDLQAEYYDAEYSVNDSRVDFKETSTALGAALECKYYMPLGIGAWLYLGLGASQLNYEFKTFGVKYDSIRTHATVGASYGF